MEVELSWLAYDRKMTDRAWEELSVLELYLTILKDDFRKKVDPRTMLFHKSQHYLLNSLENIMKNGAIDISLEEYQAHLFSKDIEELPTISDEFFFDFQIISYFTSLKMNDSYAFVESTIHELLKVSGYSANSTQWNFLAIREVDEFFDALMLLNDDHLRAVAHKLYKDKDDSLPKIKNLVRNYIEFFNYAKNNNLEIFYYNNSSNTKYWGNLIERKNERNKRIVEKVYKKFKPKGKAKKIEFPESRIELRKMHSIEPIIEALAHDQDPLIKQKAAETLGTIGDKRAIPHLIEVLKDDEPEVRQEAARALGELRAKGASKMLIEALSDDSVSVVASAAFALYLLGDTKAHIPLLHTLIKRSIIQVTVPIAFFPGIEKNTRIASLLTKAMRDTNVIVRREVAFILGELPGRKITSVLIKALADTDEEVALAAATSLIRLEAKLAKKNIQVFLKTLPLAKTVYVSRDVGKKLGI